MRKETIPDVITGEPKDTRFDAVQIQEGGTSPSAAPVRMSVAERGRLGKVASTQKPDTIESAVAALATEVKKKVPNQTRVRGLQTLIEHFTDEQNRADARLHDAALLESIDLRQKMEVSQQSAAVLQQLVDQLEREIERDSQIVAQAAEFKQRMSELEFAASKAKQSEQQVTELQRRLDEQVVSIQRREKACTEILEDLEKSLTGWLGRLAELAASVFVIEWTRELRSGLSRVQRLLKRAEPKPIHDRSDEWAAEQKQQNAQEQLQMFHDAALRARQEQNDRVAFVSPWSKSGINGV